MTSRFLIATALLAAVIAAIIATAASTQPVEDGADEDSDADRAIDLGELPQPLAWLVEPFTQDERN